jgi:hypothetical protein
LPESAASASRVSVRCTHCGDWELLHSRSYRRKLAEGRPHLCEICRAVHSLEPSAEDIDFWTSRYTHEELRAMLASIGVRE